MSTIIAQSGRTAQVHPGQDAPGRPAARVHPDAAARLRRDRLARATVEEMESALAFLSMIDPEAFEIAFTAVAPLTPVTTATEPAPAAASPVTGTALAVDEGSADDEPVPVCRECGGLVGIFLGRGLEWQHFRGAWVTSGAQEIYDPGHAATVTWLLPGEDPADL